MDARMPMDYCGQFGTWICWMWFWFVFIEPKAHWFSPTTRSRIRRLILGSLLTFIAAKMAIHGVCLCKYIDGTAVRIWFSTRRRIWVDIKFPLVCSRNSEKEDWARRIIIRFVSMDGIALSSNCFFALWTERRSLWYTRTNHSWTAMVSWAVMCWKLSLESQISHLSHAISWTRVF